MKKNKIMMTIKRNKKVSMIIVVSTILIIATAFCFYRYLGIIFGKAALGTFNAVENIKQDWETKKENPIDSVLHKTEKIIDSINEVKSDR